MIGNLLWKEARVLGIREITPTVREFTLAPGVPLQAYLAGSHLQVQVLVGGAPQTRSYSLIGTPDGSAYRIAVKRLDGGRGGSLAMWQLAVGDRLQITEPQNFFHLSLQAPAYLLVGGGIGVTPMVGMAQILGSRRPPVRMLLAARCEEELAYRDALKQALGDRLEVAVAERGEIINFKEEIAKLPVGGQMYCCGPAPMLEAAQQAWADAGRDAADLRFETFGSSGRLPPQAFKVNVQPQNLHLDVPADCGLLDTLELAGVQALYNCRRGECGLCAMDVLSLKGEIDHRDVFLSTEEKKHNQRICVCVSRVVGEITLHSAYRPEGVH